MRKFKTKYNKVASAMIIHKELLEEIAKEKKYTFISTGMSEMKDVENAVKIFNDLKADELVFLDILATKEKRLISLC